MRRSLVAFFALSVVVVGCSSADDTSSVDPTGDASSDGGTDASAETDAGTNADADAGTKDAGTKTDAEADAGTHPICGDGVIAGEETCDGANLGGATCASVPGGFTEGTLACNVLCVFDTSACITVACGDGVINGAETCDGENLAGATCASVPGGFTEGTLACGPTCAFDTSACINVTCGDGVVNGAESCDGANLNGATCASVPGGFTEGTLACNPTCGFDTSACINVTCGDGVVNGAESCDGANLNGATCATAGGFTGGALACNPTCGFDTSACTGTCGVVINEFQLLLASQAFVELHNTCATAFDLNGHRLSFRGAGATDNGASFVAWDAPTMIPGGGYYLAVAAGSPIEADADATFKVISALYWGTNGGVALRKGAANDGTIVDSVAWGTNTSFRQGTAAPRPVSAQSAARIPNGANTHDNGVDFAIDTTPTPKAANAL